MTATYSESGVDLDLGDEASRVLYEAARQTWANRKGLLGEVVVPFDDFSGVRAIDVSQLPQGSLMNVNFDGVGTKSEIAERTGNYSTLAYDLLAMVCDDAVVRGGEPIVAGSILDVNSLGRGTENFVKHVRQLAHGYVGAARDANVAVVNGELAELGTRVGGYGAFNCNWGAAVVWFARRERLFTGRELKDGDSLVAFREKGFRSNGLSLARKALGDAHGKEWHLEKLKGKTLGELALEPSRIYSRAVCEMTGGFSGDAKAEIHGVTHVTGGGLPGKLGRMLKPSGLGAALDDLFPPTDLMLYCQELGRVSDE
ncbi:MAG TPA: AIR synthase-related protein, partial [archaeon]|nr:AIR synthase-related protein [archaeon]